MASAPTLQLDVADSSRRSPHAVYTVSSLLHPDGTVQTTSQVTLDQFPNFMNGNDVQLFVQTHGAVHFQNVRRHGSVRPQHAVRDRSPARDDVSRSRSPAPCRSRVHLPDTTAHRQTAGPTIHRMLYDSFRFAYARLLHLSAVMFLCFALVMRLKKSPSGSTMCSTTRCLALLLWCILNRPNGNSHGRWSTGVSCRVGQA